MFIPWTDVPLRAQGQTFYDVLPEQIGRKGQVFGRLALGIAAYGARITLS
jgi:hypothetical protein